MAWPEVEIEMDEDTEDNDGNVHVVPNFGREHIEFESCWCNPELIDDFTADGGVKVFLHREIQ